MLKWLVDEELAMLAINTNKLISESDVECIPERVPSAIIDETIAVGDIKQFFTTDGQQIINAKKQRTT